jgi:hypothetical protein
MQCSRKHSVYNFALANGQTFLSDCSLILSSDESNSSLKKITISPNPVIANLTIFTDSNFGNATCYLFNSLGQVVKEVSNINGNIFVIQKDKLESGIYYIRISEDRKFVFSNKVVILE